MARALCSRVGILPDSVLHGQAAWLSFVDDAESVLQVLLTPDQWAAGPAV